MSYEKFFYDKQTKARGLNARALQVQFSRQAKWYRSRLGSYLPEDKDAKCLDVPCGAGNLLYFLRTQGYTNVQGFDLDSHQVDLAKQLGLPADQADVFDVLNNPENCYQLIGSLDFIEHITKDDALRLLDLCRQRLSDDGILILRTPCADGPFGAHDRYNDITHQWGLTSGLLDVLLEMVGFEQVIILDERPQPTSLVDMFRWLVFFPTMMIANLFCMALGIRPPRVWTRSMIAIAYKSAAGRAVDDA